MADALSLVIVWAVAVILLALFFLTVKAHAIERWWILRGINKRAAKRDRRFAAEYEALREKTPAERVRSAGALRGERHVTPTGGDLRAEGPWATDARARKAGL